MDFRGLVWKRVWKMTFYGLKWSVRIWRTRRHTPTKNSQEFPPPPPTTPRAGHNGKPCGNNGSDFKCCSISPDVNFNTVKSSIKLPGGLIYFKPIWSAGGLMETGGLFNLETPMVSIFHKELEYKVEKLKYKKFRSCSRGSESNPIF